MAADWDGLGALPKPGARGRELDATAPWVLVMALGIGFLAFVLNTSQGTRGGAGAAPARVLATLQARLASDLAGGGAPAQVAALQRRLEEALAQAPALQAIDWVGTDGRVRLSTEPSAIGRPADEGVTRAAARRPLADAAGTPLGELVAHATAHGAADGAAAPATTPLTLALALSTPLLALLALALAPPPDPQTPAHRAAWLRLGATRDRLARAAQEVEWLEASGGYQDTGVWTRTGTPGSRR